MTPLTSRDLPPYNPLLFRDSHRSTIVETPLNALRVRDALVRRRDRRVARILRHAAEAHRTSPLAPLIVPDNDLIRPFSYVLPLKVARQVVKVPPILELVPRIARMKVSLVVPRLVWVTLIPFPRVAVPKTGRKSELVVPNNKLVGPKTAVLRVPAYFVILSTASEGQRLV